MKLYSTLRLPLLLLGFVLIACSIQAQDECNDPFACNFNPEGSGIADCCYTNCLTLTMMDGFGDGWNGAVWEVADLFTGNVVATGTLVDGLEEIVNICLLDGCYYFNVGSGNFDAEVTWILQGATSGDIGGGAPSQTFFTVGSTCLTGCTDSSACNFDALALIDDGSCNFECNGCTDSLACNFSADATIDDGSCEYPPANDTFETSVTVSFSSPAVGSLCCASEVVDNPCMSSTSTYGVWYHVNSSVCEDLIFNVSNIDGSGMGMTIWVDSCQGCNDIYPIACCPEVTGTCAGSLASITTLIPSWDYYFNVWTANPETCGTFSFELSCTSDGCTDPQACNYDPNALQDDGSCLYLDDCGVCGGNGIPGCNNPNACNYDSNATCSDGSCVFPEIFYLDCEGNCLSDLNNDGICDGQPVFGCDTEFACNYDPNVTDNDGSCYFATAVYDCDGNCQTDTDGDGICDQNEGQNGAEFCGSDTVWDPITQTCIGVDDCPADLNNSGNIDTTDLLLFLISFGTPCE